MKRKLKPKFSTRYGKYYLADSVQLIRDKLLRYYRGKINLLITSPPFPLNKKKKYGNRQGKEYKAWFVSLAPLFSELLAEDGSIVIELGNAWMPQRPVQSLLHLESMLDFVKNEEAGLRLCQEFICYNPSRLPTPAQWVTIERIRAVDSYTHVWWMSKTDYPKANNKKVLRPYSKSMEQLLKRKKYNDGPRPSEHRISQNGFLKKHKGNIVHNLIELEQIDPSRQVRLPHNVLSFSNTISNDAFLTMCKEKEVKPHPARMSESLAAFFIEFLTDQGDCVLDPFAGSNTTGYCAEKLKRKWISVELNKEYVKQAKLRFPKNNQKSKKK